MAVPFVDIAFLIVALGLLVAIGYFDIRAAMSIQSLASQVPALTSAHRYATWGSVLAILGAVFVIVLLILFFAFNTKTFRFGTAITVLFIITLILIFFSGILSAATAAQLNNTTQGDANIRKVAYHDAVIGTLLGIIGFVLLGGLLIVIRVYAHRHQQQQAMSRMS